MADENTTPTSTPSVASSASANTGIKPQPAGTNNYSLAGYDTAPTNIGKFLLNWQNKIEIATDGLDNVNDITKAAWARLAAGINNLTPAENDTTANDEYYDGEGFGTSDVTSKRYQFTVAGHRVYSDKAQDYIASKMLEIGDNLKTLMRVTFADGSQVYGIVTLTNIVPAGGQPGAKQTFSFVAVFNGKPKFVPASAKK